MSLANFIKLLIALALPQLAGLIGTVFTTPAIPGWYRTLAKPELAPPNWVFAPVWTTLFLLMGIAAYLVWKRGLRERGVQVALLLFLVQLALNTLWSFMFFGLRSPLAGLIEIAFLWAAILATAISFARISRIAAWLLAPYLLWVSFAAYLTWSIWVLNP